LYDRWLWGYARAAGHEGRIHLDLCDDGWRAVPPGQTAPESSQDDAAVAPFQCVVSVLAEQVIVSGPTDLVADEVIGAGSAEESRTRRRGGWCRAVVRAGQSRLRRPALLDEARLRSTVRRADAR
jgi:hypothetical protein